MDPSYNNQVGGFGSGGISSGGGQVPQQPVMSPVSSAPISSGAGDVILGSAGKKSRKGLVIGLIVVVLLVVGGLLAGVFLTRGGNDSDVSTEAKLAFNRYANYFLYGEDSDEPLKNEYDEGYSYQIDLMQIENEEGVSKFFAKADELLNNFDNAAKQTKNQELIVAVDKYKSNFGLLKNIDDINGVDDEIYDGAVVGCWELDKMINGERNIENE